jgi:hypothetical protein
MKMVKREHIRPGFTVAIVCVVLLVVVQAALPATAEATLPPRPIPETPTPVVPPTPLSRPSGGLIRLRVQFPQSWPWTEAPWQGLWTVVQWQDVGGEWHDVTGRQGGLDDLSILDAAVVGKRLWWVADSDLGKGPFRWLIYSGEQGEVVGLSQSFALPVRRGETVEVEVMLEP